MNKTPHWTNHWDRISAQIAQRPRLLIASDFDGTLTPIALTPAQAVLAPETRTLLRRLAACDGVSLAIISGRALADVQLHVGVEGVFYVGNHGLELCGPAIELHSPQAAKARGPLAQAVAFLVENTALLEGVFVEDKGASASVHWRLASKVSQEILCELVHAVAEAQPLLRLAAGKCVWELRPKAGWNKGDALSYLSTRLKFAPEDTLYLGDDLTDEDAFRVVRSGLAFRVGGDGEETAAQYRIRDAADAQAFLLCTLGIRTGRLAGPSSGETLATPALLDDDEPLPIHFRAT